MKDALFRLHKINIQKGFGWKKMIHHLELYTNWIKDFDQKKCSRALKICDRFVNSTDFRLNHKHMID